MESAFVRGKMFKTLTNKYLDWKNNVGKWISDCIEDHGIPMFRTKYDANIDGVVVTGVCYGGENRVGSVHFVNVPKEDLIIIEETTGEWRVFKKKYGGVKEWGQMM